MTMNQDSKKTQVEVNQKKYAWPTSPTVVVCIDGGDPAYLKQFLADGSIPNLSLIHI